MDRDHDDVLRSTVVPALEALANDGDPDVAFYASQSLARAHRHASVRPPIGGLVSALGNGGIGGDNGDGVLSLSSIGEDGALWHHDANALRAMHDSDSADGPYQASPAKNQHQKSIGPLMHK